MLLKRGITGLYESGYGLNELDGKYFKQICYLAVKNLNGSVVSFEEPSYPKNYYTVRIETTNLKRYILLNNHYPFMAFATSVNSFKITFIDDVELLKEFKEFYPVLSVKQLNEKLDTDFVMGGIRLVNKNDLSPVELTELAYWEPRTVGEVIFNQWD